MSHFQTDEDKVSLSDRRIDLRKPIYLGEGFRVEVQIPSGRSGLSEPLVTSQTLDAEIIDLSPAGLGIAIDPQALPENLTPGMECLITPQLLPTPFSFQAVLVNISHTLLSQKNMTRLGFMYFSPQKVRGQSLRRHTRFSVHEVIFPSAFCTESLFFQESFCFRIKELSRTGALLDTNDLDAHFIPNLRLNLEVFIPSQGHFQQRVRIVSYRQGDRLKQTELSIEWIQPSSNFLEAISGYLLYFDLASLRDLRQEGFELNETAPLFSVGIPQTSQEWSRILELRLGAYQAVGKFQQAKGPEDMMDIYDSYARHLICRNKGKIVGCARVVFVNFHKERSEHFNLGVPVPNWLWEADFVEVSRLCTDEQYRGGDVLLSLFRHIGKIVYQSGKRYIVANCNPEMWKTYRQLGFRKTGVRFEAFGRTDCDLIAVDCRDILEGTVQSPLQFNFITLPISRFLFQRQRPQRSALTVKIRIRIHTFFHSLIKSLVFALKRRKQKLKKVIKNAR